MIPAVWTRQLLKLVSEMFRDYDSSRQSTWSHHAYELLIALPPADAEIIILLHEAKLKSDPDIIQAAVLVGTPRLQEWVQAILAQEPDLSNKTFKHIGLRIGMGRSYFPPWHSKLRFLRNLEPFLNRISLEEKRKMMREPLCVESEWCLQHILPLLESAERKLYELSEEGLAALMPELDEDGFPEWHADRLFDSAKAKGWGSREVIEFLVKRASDKQDNLSYRWAVAAIGARGSRDDLETLINLRENVSPDLLHVRREAEIQVSRRTL